MSWRATLVAVLAVLAGACSPAVTARPSPSASSPPTAATTSPTAVSPTAGPTAFNPLSVTWISPSTGWALGTASCAAGGCLALLRTDDAGHAWRPANAPAAQLGQISGVRFADQANGWIFGGELWSTHDGARTWTKQPAPGTVAALEATGGRVHAAMLISGGEGPGGVQMFASPTGSDDWQPSGSPVGFGAGPVPRSAVVATHGAAWLVQVNRTVLGGARLVAGAWRDWQPPCLDGGGDANLAAASATYLVAVCNEGEWFNFPPATRLYVSRDGGATFARAPAELPAASSAVASPVPGTVFSGGPDRSGNGVLLVTRDGGATWATAYSAPLRFPIYLGFTTVTQGVAILRGDPVNSLLMTSDGGRRWTAVDFSPPA